MEARQLLSIDDVKWLIVGEYCEFISGEIVGGGWEGVMGCWEW